MNPSEIIFGSFLIVLLLALAGYYAWRQKNTLKLLRQQVDLAPEDRAYLHRQVRRRLLCSILMVVFAGLLVGWFFMSGDVHNLEPTEKQKLEAGQQVATNPEQKESVQFFTLYVIMVFAVLFAILFLAALDILATARFGLRHVRKLEADRRATLDDQVALLRKQRNGQG